MRDKIVVALCNFILKFASEAYRGRLYIITHLGSGRLADFYGFYQQFVEAANDQDAKLELLRQDAELYWLCARIYRRMN